ncbi:MAG: phosphotransferase [Actinomycetes bacterium]
MPRSPLALAALASVAVPGLDVYDVLRSPLADADFDVVIVKDATGQRWMVRAPRRAAAGAALEAEMGVLRALTRAREAGLIEFEVARPAGAATIAGESGGRAVVYSDIQGSPLVLAAVEPGPGLAASIGRTIAQIHELPTTLVEDQGLPSYTAEEYRQRRLAELDAGAQTGLVPPRLADRWEQQLENISWWRFEPTVVHGDMGEHQLMVREGIVTGVLDWMDTRVADPADDLAWLVAAAPEDVLDSVMEAYMMGRRELRDPHLLDRARLASELALLRWLMYGVRTENADVIEDGRGMLADLEALLFDSEDEAPPEG